MSWVDFGGHVGAMLRSKSVLRIALTKTLKVDSRLDGGSIFVVSGVSEIEGKSIKNR